MRNGIPVLAAILAVFLTQPAGAEPNSEPNAEPNEAGWRGAQGNPYLAYAAAGLGNPGLPEQRVGTVASVESAARGLLDSLSSISDRSMLPTFKTLYPTGEKPLVVISFKCPTELIGVTPPPTKLLHGAVDLGIAGINKTDLLSFNLQQVCG